MNGIGTSRGVSGTASSGTGIGIQGSGNSTTGANFGSYATSASTSGTGAYGEATATTGTTYGVYGKGNSLGGYAGYFTNVGTGLYAEATNPTGTTYGVYGKSASSSGYGGYFENLKTSGTTYGLSALASSGSGYGIYADNNAASGSPLGVYGKCTNGIGMMGDSGAGTGVFAQASGNGNALIANLNSPGTSSTSVANLAVFQAAGTNVARIDNTGKGFFNGGTQASGADFAESVAVNAPKAEFEPGDVIAIDVEGRRRFALSTEAESSLVAGVYSTKPALLGTTHEVAGDQAAMRDEIPLAVVGIVPTKVCDEGGPVKPGDLLVTASLPGYAKKASRSPAAGTVLGKALDRLESGHGVIEVLLMAR